MLKIIKNKIIKSLEFPMMGFFTPLTVIYIDEVSITLDLSPTTTYETSGAKMVEIRKTSGIKQMFTALLGVLSNGFKLPPFLVFKTKSQINVPEELSPYLIAKNNLQDWINYLT